VQPPHEVKISYARTYERDIKHASLGEKTSQAVDEAWAGVVAAVRDNPNYPDVSRAGTPLPRNKSEVYKLRIPDPDRNTGKSGGYRLIYWWRRAERELVGLLFFHKSEKEDATQSEIDRARKSFGSKP
jgi:mRNA-degrading endonuclease RelE of RelBE toxin-antitoxin system